MNAKSKILALAILAAGYSFLYWAYTTAFAAPEVITPGYRYLIVLVAVPLFLAAHGIALARWRNPKSKSKQAICSPNLVGRHTTLEVFLTWLAISSVLMCLYYISPADDLRDWYPRFFLILTVVFAATLDRALVFVCGMMPFMLTLSGLAFWTYDRNSLLVWNASLEPLAALALLTLDFIVFLWAVRLARRSGVFGSPSFQAHAELARLGGVLSGVISTTAADNSDAGYLVQLSCVGTRGDSLTSEVLWSNQCRVAGEPSQERRGQIDVPVQFRLPKPDDGFEGADSRDGRWLLRVQSALPEADFRATFEVPVLQSDERARHCAPVALRHPDQARAKSFATATAAGKARFRFAELWNSSSELVAAAACLFWVQLIWLTTREPMGWAGWGMLAVGLVVLARVIGPWLVKTTVVCGDSSLRVTNERLFIRSRHSTLKSAVCRIRVERGKMRSGAAASLQYYRLIVECDDGREIAVGRHLRDRTTAEQAALEIEAAICQTGLVENATAPAANRVVAMPKRPPAQTAPHAAGPAEQPAARPGQLVAFHLPDAPEPHFQGLEELAMAVDNVPEPMFVYETA